MLIIGFCNRSSRAPEDFLWFCQSLMSWMLYRKDSAFLIFFAARYVGMLNLPEYC